MIEQVVPYVRPMAKKLQCPVQFLRVIEPISQKLADPVHSHYLGQIASSIRTQAEDSLLRLRSAFAMAGVEASSTAFATAHEGSPAASIVNEANKDPGPAMGRYGGSGDARRVLGSVTDKVLHGATNPRLIIRSQAGPGPEQEAVFKTIIVPLEGTDR